MENLLVEDLETVFNEADSMIINSETKVGKIAFVFCLVKLLFNENALMFSSQEPYLFNKKLGSLTKQFPQFQNIGNYFVRYSIYAEEWDSLKRQYGYAFLLEELERIITSHEEKVILFHKLENFFDFQDRYEIEKFYKSLVQIVTKQNKRIIFIVNNQNQNYKYIQGVAEEFSDISITLSKNERNERMVDIRNILSNQEYPSMEFLIHEKNFILQYLDEDKESEENRVKDILLVEFDSNLDTLHTNMVKIYQYIFDKSKFHFHHANSFQSILHNIFIKPDVIIVLMNRNDENFELIQDIKKQLPDTTIIVVIEQDFVRTEDIQKAYNYGCDELFPKTYLFDKFILSLQKSMKSTFYSERLKLLPKPDNILERKDDFLDLVDSCLDNTIFFSLFILENNEMSEHLKSTMRRLDYMYVKDDKIYYLALNTMPETIEIILKKQYEIFNEKLELISVCTPLEVDKLKKYLCI